MSRQAENDSLRSGSDAEVSAVRLIDGRFELDLGAPLPELDSSHAAAFAVQDRKGEHAALCGLIVAPGVAWRGSIAATQLTLRHPSLLRVLRIAPVMLPDDSAARATIVMERPRGRRLSTRPGPVSEEMLRHVVLPSLIDGLQALHDHDITHRAVRPGNLFFASEHEDGIVLGDYVSAPPGYDQAADFEVIERATASLEGRGEGTPACDLFALGVTIARLIDDQAETPQDAAACLIARMERGSFDVLASRTKCSATVRELISGLLIDDPEHRWTLDKVRDWLLNPRASSPAQRRPRDGGRPYVIRGQAASQPRAVAHLYAQDTEAARQDIQRGHLARWLRSNFGLHEIAEEIDNLVGRADELARGRRTIDEDQVARVCCILDRSGPLRYRGKAIMPDGFGGALAQAGLAADAEAFQGIARMISLGLPGLTLRPPTGTVGDKRLDELHTLLRNRLRSRQPELGILVCLYELNPELPCLSRFVRNDLAIGPRRFLEALDRYAGSKKEPGDRPLDDHAHAYIIVHLPAEAIKRAHAISFKIRSGTEAVTDLAFYAALQGIGETSTTPKLARWLAERVVPTFDSVRSTARRARLVQVFKAKAATGDLNALLDALLDPREHRADDQEYRAALQRYHDLGAQLHSVKQAAYQRRSIAATAIGQRLATALAAATLIGACFVAVFGSLA